MNRLRVVAGAVFLYLFFSAFAAAGAGGIVSIGYHLVDSHRWLGLSIPASAVVEERHLYKSGDESDRYEATVIFTTEAGEEVVAKVRGDGLEPGSRVSIRYDPAEPSRVRKTGWAPYWLGPVAAIPLFAFFLACGAIPLVTMTWFLIRGRTEFVAPEGTAPFRA